MAGQQSDLFGVSQPNRPSEELLAIIRARLHATLALVRGADRMPWDDHLTIIHADNAFRFDKDRLPAAEGATLWAEFDTEMERLYAIMNAELARMAETDGDAAPDHDPVRGGSR